MKLVVLAAGLLLISMPARAGAQLLGPGPAAGEEIVTVNLKTGLLAPMTTFDDADFGETSYATGLAYGAGITAWPALGRKVGVRVSLIRSETDGESEYEYAPIVVNSPSVWLFSTEVAARMPMGVGYPYASIGYGMKQYTWKNATYQADRDGALTGAVGLELRPRSLGGLGLNLEARGYRTSYRAFAVNDGTWEFDDYGGKVGGVPNLDLLFTTGVSLHF